MGSRATVPVFAANGKTQHLYVDDVVQRVREIYNEMNHWPGQIIIIKIRNGPRTADRNAFGGTP
jgi:hypothetical protein